MKAGKAGGRKEVYILESKISRRLFALPESLESQQCAQLGDHQTMLNGFFRDLDGHTDLTRYWADIRLYPHPCIGAETLRNRFWATVNP